MDVTSLTNASAGGVATPTDKTKLGKDDFLKLMLAQLQQQDPTSPSDSAAFVAQLAQFANVEQLQGVNQQLESILISQTAGNQTNTVGLLGKDVQFKSDQLDFDGVAPAGIHGNLSKDAATVTAVITDANGKKVRTVTLNTVPKGEVDFTWDGRDDDGNMTAKGPFTVKLTASDTSGTNIPIDQYGSGRVSGITYIHGYPELKVGGRTLTLRDIISVTQPGDPQ